MSNHLNFNTGIHDRSHLTPCQVRILDDNRKLCLWVNRCDDVLLRDFDRRTRETFLNVLTHIVQVCSEKGVCSDTQQYIADAAKCSRLSVNEAIKFFRRYGVLNVIRRNNRSSLYALPKCLRRETVTRAKLAPLLPCIRLLIVVTTLIASPLARAYYALQHQAVSLTQAYNIINTSEHSSCESCIRAKTYIRRVSVLSESGQNVASGWSEAYLPTPEERLFAVNALEREQRPWEICDEERSETEPSLQVFNNFSGNESESPTNSSLHSVDRIRGSLSGKNSFSVFTESGELLEGDNKKKEILMRPISDFAKPMQSFIDELLQQTLTPQEIDNTRKKLCLITPLNKRICSGLGLSHSARVTNAMFPDDALRWAANNVKRCLEGEERYEHFYKLCHAYCTEHDVVIDLALQDKLYSLFGESSTDPKVTLHRIHAPLPRTKRRPTHYEPPRKKQVVYDKPTGKERILTPNEIHMIKYGLRDKKKEEQLSWPPSQRKSPQR